MQFSELTDIKYDQSIVFKFEEIKQYIVSVYAAVPSLADSRGIAVVSQIVQTIVSIDATRSVVSLVRVVGNVDSLTYR